MGETNQPLFFFFAGWQPPAEPQTTRWQQPLRGTPAAVCGGAAAEVHHLRGRPGELQQRLGGLPAADEAIGPVGLGVGLLLTSRRLGLLLEIAWDDLGKGSWLVQVGLLVEIVHFSVNPMFVDDDFVNLTGVSKPLPHNHRIGIGGWRELCGKFAGC